MDGPGSQTCSAPIFFKITYLFRSLLRLQLQIILPLPTISNLLKDREKQSNNKLKKIKYESPSGQYPSDLIEKNKFFYPFLELDIRD